MPSPSHRRRPSTGGASARYAQVRERLDRLLEDEDDWIAALATIACELHGAFDHHEWTGFYRVVGPELLVVGPYQGGHGRLRIPFAQACAGRRADAKRTQRVDDVTLWADHIACSSTTRSEIRLRVAGRLPGRSSPVLDVDSDALAAFAPIDQEELEHICADLASRFPEGEGSRSRT